MGQGTTSCAVAKRGARALVGRIAAGADRRATPAGPLGVADLTQPAAGRIAAQPVHAVPAQAIRVEVAHIAKGYGAPSLPIADLPHGATTGLVRAASKWRTGPRQPGDGAAHAGRLAARGAAEAPRAVPAHAPVVACAGRTESAGAGAGAVADTPRAVALRVLSGRNERALALFARDVASTARLRAR